MNHLSNQQVNQQSMTAASLSESLDMERVMRRMLDLQLIGRIADPRNGMEARVRPRNFVREDHMERALRFIQSVQEGYDLAQETLKRVQREQAIRRYERWTR